MKKFSQIVSRLIDSYRQEQYEPVLEMATISKKLKVGNTTYKVAVHGPASKDPYKEFNFEISLVDLLCYNELNLVTMIDKEKHLNITNRNKCSWKGYRGLHDEFKDWLERPSEFPGDFNNNLEAIVWNYDNENNEDDALLNYIKNHGKKVNNKHKIYFKK